MISTVIEFASNPDIPVPINVDAQTSDNLGLIILGLILAATVGFLLFNVYKGKMSLNVKGMHSKSQVVISNNKFIAATLIAVAIAALMCIFCISNSAFAANGVNVTSTEKVTATYDQATGKVTFEEAFVTSEEETQLDFNSIQLKLMDGIDDGHCN
ncbi:MAG: hypothetical protein Q4F54_04685 [Coriobacteriia bacterium]|nr:hypothetical protein [Coriobacteriia bacterium]